MEAFARPGEVRTLCGIAAPAPLAPVAAALVRSLADYETPIWLDRPLTNVPAIAEWIRFHTGARIVQEPRDAVFAIVGNPDDIPDFAQFAMGSEEYPDRSTTIIVQIKRFDGRAFAMEGPGINGVRSLAAEPLSDDFADRLRANRELFPRGIDLVLVAEDHVAALPRSIRVSSRT
jgi:alpha-D-ribose 1-methylphosphonate 5-triphosphate synthase subunit PhnH